MTTSVDNCLQPHWWACESSQGWDVAFSQSVATNSKFTTKQNIEKWLCKKLTMTDDIMVTFDL